MHWDKPAGGAEAYARSVSVTRRVRARAPEGPIEPPATLRAPDEVATYLFDASRLPGGATPRVLLPRSEGEVAWAVRNEPRLLAAGAQSSLTGGSTPRGEAVLSFQRMAGIVELRDDLARVEAGLPLLVLEEALAARDLAYPPVPTFTGATVGGTVSTNAAGAATWKHGTTRRWVEGLTVVLATGDVLDLRRGEVRSGPAGRFEVELPGGRVLEVPVPTYRMPDVPKRSAGYHAEPDMDLVDLFVGSEGTLGVVTRVELRLVARPPQLLVALVACPSEAAALELTATLRDASRATWAAGDPLGVDVRAIESADRRSLQLLREEGADRTAAVSIAPGTDTLLWVQLELPRGVDAEGALQEAWGEAGRDGPLHRFVRLLQARDLLDGVEVALPDDRSRRAQLFQLREAVPVAANHRVQAAQREVDPAIHKVGGDMIVPFARFPGLMARYREVFAGLDLAIWGHVSDGNVHPNVLPRSKGETERGKEALLQLGREVMEMGGCPLSEHGTGRNPVKQALLRLLYGERGIEEMRAVKRALDPEWKLAPGVLFPPP